MPKFKRQVSNAPDQQAAAVYEGPDVPDGTYSGILRWMKYRESRKKGTPFWNNLVVLDAKDKEGSNAKYDGYAVFVEVYMVDESDVNEAREKSLYTAISGKADVDIITDDKVQGDPIVTKVGGFNPSGTRVYVQLRTEYDEEYGSRQRGTWIYPDPSFQRDGQKDDQSDITGEDLDAEAAAEAPPKRTRKAPAKKATTSNVTPIKAAQKADDGELDYDAMNLPDIRQEAAKHNLEVKGVPKGELIKQLKAIAGGDAGDPNKKSPKQITAMGDDELNEFLEANDYVVEDFDGMSREDTVEILKDDGIINPF